MSWSKRKRSHWTADDLSNETITIENVLYWVNDGTIPSDTCLVQWYALGLIDEETMSNSTKTRNNLACEFLARVRNYNTVRCTNL